MMLTMLSAVNWSAGPPVTSQLLMVFFFKVILTAIALAVGIKIVRVKSSLISVLLISFFTYLTLALSYYFFAIFTPMTPAWCSFTAMLLAIFIFFCLFANGTEGHFAPEGIIIFLILVIIHGGVEMAMKNFEPVLFLTERLPFVQPLLDMINGIAPGKG